MSKEMWILSIIEIMLSVIMLWVLIKISNDTTSIKPISNATDNSSHSTGSSSQTSQTSQASQIDPIEVISSSQGNSPKHTNVPQVDDKDFIVLKFRATAEDDMEFDVFLFVDKKGNRTDADKK